MYMHTITIGWTDTTYQFYFNNYAYAHVHALHMTYELSNLDGRTTPIGFATPLV